MRFEHRHQPVIKRSEFWRRVAWHLVVATPFVAISLALGAAGLHYTENTPWLDALVNSAMLLGGMGPIVDHFEHDSAKWFSIFFALYSGLVLVVSGAWIVSPVFHRILHKFHADDKDAL